MFSTVAQIIIAAAAVLLTAIGTWIAQDHRRQLRVKLADRRYEAYASLWEISGQIRVRSADKADAELRDSISIAMDDWYFNHGYGMLLSTPARLLFFAIKQDLVCPPDQMVPESLRARILELPEGSRSALITCSCRRYMSILRAQLKSDLAIYGTLVHDKRLPDERDLLISCGLSPGELGTTSRPSRSICTCGNCPGPTSGNVFSGS
jgi:hypothetical protein